MLKRRRKLSSPEVKENLKTRKKPAEKKITLSHGADDPIVNV